MYQNYPLALTFIQATWLDVNILFAKTDKCIKINQSVVFMIFKRF